MNKIIFLGLVVTLITGCGAEIAYKQGASARDLQANKAACQDAATEAALHECLEKNGWAVQKLGEQWLSDDDLFATASVSESNQMPAKAKKSETFKTTDSIKREETTSEVPVATTTEPKSASAKPAIKSELKADVNETVKPITTEANIKPQHNLLETYEIKSWWKMGGGPALLEQNMNACSTTLGEAHQPNKKTFTFTRGFAICMREKGWRGLISQSK